LSLKQVNVVNLRVYQYVVRQCCVRLSLFCAWEFTCVCMEGQFEIKIVLCRYLNI